MSAAPIAALIDIRVRAIDQAPNEKNKMRARARKGGTPTLRSVTDVNMVEDGPDTTRSAAERRHQHGSLRHREPIDGTEVTERTPV
jgi:hypothetical protein